MKKNHKRIKEAIRNVAQKIADNSVGKSIPIVIHEPKVPKKLIEKEL